jgi:carbonic anhydrase/acetyltransferase-like protein (isoleucine patch superfamily)
MIYELEDRRATIAEDCYVAPNATLIGSIVLEPGASVWWNAVLRGDFDTITVGEGSNIQDGAVLHTDPGLQLVIGKNVTVGHMAMVHGCRIGDHSLIGINSVVLNRAVIGKCCVIGANALVTEGKVIPDYSVVMGSPGKIVKTLEPDEVAPFQIAAMNYVQNAKRYRDHLRPDPRFVGK